MLTINKAFRFVLLAGGLIILSGLVSNLAAQSESRGSNPCEIGIDSHAAPPEPDTDYRPIKTSGLTPADDGAIVYDSNQGLCWLADANLAGDQDFQKELGVAGINPDGTMDYATALNWVNALNHYDNGRGYLGRTNWQLPDTPMTDHTCSSFNNGNFGVSCTGSALGNLYSVGLTRTFPDSVVPDFTNTIGPFRNLQPSLYWTSDQNSGGEVTFSFNTDLNGANTTKYNYFHVLAMALGPIGPLPPGSAVSPYTGGIAAGKAVYDPNTQISWTMDANLAARNNFGVKGVTTISSAVNGSNLTVPLIDVDGAMLLDTADQPGGWLAAMNESHYAGTNNWMLPGLADIQALFQDLKLQPGGEKRLEAEGRVGPFRHLQPFFYWACERDDPGSSQSPCDPTINPGTSANGTLFQYSFNFDDGFEGTDLDNKQFYVMVYYPAPPEH